MRHKVKASTKTDQAYERWWGLVESIEQALQGQRGYDKQEQRLMLNLRYGVSDIILAHRQRLTPHTTRASVFITALDTKTL